MVGAKLLDFDRRLNIVRDVKAFAGVHLYVLCALQRGKELAFVDSPMLRLAAAERLTSTSVMQRTTRVRQIFMTIYPWLDINSEGAHVQ